MKTSTFQFVAVIAAICLLSSSVALAKNGGNGNKGGNSKFSGGKSNGGSNGFKVGLGIARGVQGLNSGKYNGNGGNNNGNCNGNYGNGGNGGNYNNGNCAVDNYGQNGGLTYAGQAYEPFHSSYVVLPGDSFYTVSLKEYGTSANAKYIAQFNRLSQGAALVPGQTLMLPSIAVNGALTPSRAPVAESLQGSQLNSSVANLSKTGGVPSSLASAISGFTGTTGAAVAEPARPKVTIGSTLLVDGQTFGDKPGAARLKVSGLSLPIEVLEWTTSSVKIHLPQVELTSATNADIEVVRADGTLASKSAIELNAATDVAVTK